MYWLFPNVQLLPFGEALQLVRAYPEPGDPGRHTSRITSYLRQGATIDVTQTEVFWVMAQKFGEVIRDEDYVISASQQRTANGGIVPHVVFGRNEPALHHYHQTYRSRLAMDPLPLLEA
ncbi:MAG: SRPBCC family protein [Actinomycetota bacterium]|nr:SRPBCC family protein [Actinomycetota bacterium]